ARGPAAVVPPGSPGGGRRRMALRGRVSGSDPGTRGHLGAAAGAGSPTGADVSRGLSLGPGRLAAVSVTSAEACDNRSAVSEPSGTMLVMLPSPAPGGAPARLTVGVAARLSRYLQVLTQAKKMGKERISSQ